MKLSLYSIKTGVLANLALLILAAMLLVNVVLLKFEERNLIQARQHTGRLLFRVLEEKIGTQVHPAQRGWKAVSTDPALRNEIQQLLQIAGFYNAFLVDTRGRNVYELSRGEKTMKKALLGARQALATGNEACHLHGNTWGVVWLAHKYLSLSFPMQYKGSLIGAATLTADLEPLYQRLRKTEKIVLFYIFLNTVLLVLVGLYLLSRIVVKPIYKLLKITEAYKEGQDVPPVADAPRNEIGELSRSLNLMLKRLADNKKELQAHIASLEKANQEIKRAQEELVRAEKSASVGRLATGLAHEIGNPIGIILGYLELLRGDRLDSEESRDSLHRIEAEITRIHQIIRQLLDFSRPSSGDPENTPVHDLITGTLEMLDPQPMLSHIDVRPRLEAAADVVRADPNQLKQVFLNVIMNAADAMVPDEHACQAEKDNRLVIHTRNTETRLLIDFSDTGTGIAESDLPHVFDPFFTTKEPGKGTGMGLSVCSRIVEALGGTINAANNDDRGATIRLVLPLKEQAVPGVAAEKHDVK